MGRKTEKTTRIHRFCDVVALDTESMKKTVYLTPEMALAFAMRLKQYAKDCQRTTFGKSKLGTCDIEQIGSSKIKTEIFISGKTHTDTFRYNKK